MAFLLLGGMRRSTPQYDCGRDRPGSVPRRLVAPSPAPRRGTAAIAGDESPVKLLSSALSTAALAVIAAVGVLLPRTAQSATPTFVQGTAFSTGSRVPALPV